MVLEEVEWNERQASEVATKEGRAEISHLEETGRIALEVHGLTVGRAGARTAIDVEVDVLATLGPGVGHVQPVVRAPLHVLLAIGPACTPLDAVQPIGLE